MTNEIYAVFGQGSIWLVSKNLLVHYLSLAHCACCKIIINSNNICFFLVIALAMQNWALFNSFAYLDYCTTKFLRSKIGTSIFHLPHTEKFIWICFKLCSSYQPFMYLVISSIQFILQGASMQNTCTKVPKSQLCFTFILTKQLLS